MRKRIDGIFRRIHRHLPWTDWRGLRCHDIRHTSGRLIYKAADEQMARLHLAHDAGSTTDHYLTDHLDELRKLKETLFASPSAGGDA
jgi:integrase